MARRRRVSLETAQREIPTWTSDYLRLITLPNHLLMQAINEQLTPKQKKYILEYYFNAKTLTQIADENGLDVSTVSRTVTRARSRLIEAFRYYKKIK